MSNDACQRFNHNLKLHSDLFALMSVCGITLVTRRLTQCAGMLISLFGESAIIIDNGLTQIWASYVVAHIMAHIALGHTMPDIATISHATEYRNPQCVAADSIAAKLFLPPNSADMTDHHAMYQAITQNYEIQSLADIRVINHIIRTRSAEGRRHA